MAHQADVIGRDGVVARRTGRSLAPRALVPALARAATAGPVLAASAVAVTALAAAKVVERAVRLAGRDLPPPTGSTRLEVTWIRVDIRRPS